MTSNQSLGEPKSAVSIINASNYVGVGSAVTGAAFAAGYATLKGRPVVLWTIAAGGQCGVLGWTFWFTRSLLRQSAQQDGTDTLPSQRKDLIYSTVAGSLSGTVGGAFRGRANIVPGAIMMGLAGLGGQVSYNILSAAAIRPHDRRPLLVRLSDSKWWPLKVLSDEDYERELTEKIIAIEAEVSMIDDRIRALKQGR